MNEMGLVAVRLELLKDLPERLELFFGVLFRDAFRPREMGKDALELELL